MNNAEQLAAQQKEPKERIAQELRRVPIVQIACEKHGISRATYYRWRGEDAVFRKSTDEALAEGRALVNDVAEGKLLSAIKDGNMTAIIYWLKNNNNQYREKVELSGSVEQRINRELTPEEKKMIEDAILLAMPLKKEDKSDGHNSE